MEAVVLYRPVGQEELDLVEASGWRRFPPRLDWQPIFYPVTTEEYASRIAAEWNTRDGGVGYVLRFAVDAGFIGRYEPHEVGGRACTEYWIPADQLEELNDAIVGCIELLATYRRSEPHEVQIVERTASEMARWTCSCGASSGGRWFESPQEALKKAERHQRRHRR